MGAKTNSARSQVVRLSIDCMNMLHNFEICNNILYMRSLWRCSWPGLC